jgi:quercetin dioxygenase-like cupin family protein
VFNIEFQRIKVMMFYKKNKEGYHSRVKDIDQKTLVFGDRTLMAEFKLKKGAVVPRHSHPYEQTGYLVSGRMIFISGEEQFEVLPGDSWCILINVEHSAEVLEDSVAVEVFSPVREDYLPGEKL